MKKIIYPFSILALTTMFLAACGESYYKQDQQRPIQFNFQFNLFSNNDQYNIHINPPDLFWDDVGFYFNNTSFQILMTKIDKRTRRTLSNCADYDFSDSLNDFKGVKDYWMDRQLRNNRDFKEFLEDIDPYLKSPVSCNAAALHTL